MKNFLTAVVCVLMLTQFSCQKEVDGTITNGNNGGNGNQPGTLKRLVFQGGTDSSVYSFSYNSAGKIIGINISTVSSGVSELASYSVERNSQGTIQKITAKSSELAQFGIDSLITNVTFAAGRYTSRKMSFSVAGFTASYTSFYSYDANGKIVSQKDYVDDGTGSIDSSRYDYTFNGSNLASLKGYNLNAGSNTPDLTQVFEYDSKQSPLIVGNEAFVLNNFQTWYSANNFTKMTVNVDGDPVTHVATWNFTYNSANKPSIASITQDGQSGGTGKYYYN